MTILQFISTSIIIALFGSLRTPAGESCELTKSDPAKILDKLQGTWIHSEDSLATVEISGSIWTFIHIGELRPTDFYKIDIIDSLPEYVDPEIISDFLILSNQTDTLEYEIFGLTDSTLGLMYFPRGNMHLYRKTKD